MKRKLGRAKMRWVPMLIGILVLPPLAHAAEPADRAAIARMLPSPDAPLSIMSLRGGVYWVSGGVSNTGFIVGDKGVIAIDPQMFVVTARNELAEIAKITPKPVNEIILTHSDPDHINGLPGFPRGIDIIAHENAKRDMTGVVADPASNGTPPPPDIQYYLPTRTISRTETMTLDGVRLVLMHVAPAHTDGDVAVFLPKQKVVFTGDLVAPNVGLYPVVHLNKHASSLGWIRFMKAILALDADTYVSGHGQMLSKQELRTRLDTTVQRRKQIAALVAQGKSLQEVRTALNEPEPAGAAALFPSFTATTFQELTGKEAHK
jgi:glyoxylase-like metal-dependent hydrolase (beta-lactamase superfamily II)